MSTRAWDWLMNSFSILKALIVDDPCSDSPKWEYIGDRDIDSSRFNCRDVLTYNLWTMKKRTPTGRTTIMNIGMTHMINKIVAMNWKKLLRHP